MNIKVITLKMPWCFWVGMGWKTIETRTHKNFMKLKGQTIGIHAGLGWDKNWEILAGKYLTEDQKQTTRNMLRLSGNILGIVDVIDARELLVTDSQQALIDCGETKRYGLILENFRYLNDVVPFVGRLSAQNYKLNEQLLEPT